jgi:hypothetical protein
MPIETNAPEGVPQNVAVAHFSEAAPETVELKIKAVKGPGVKAYGFAYDRVPVPMTNGQGKFWAVREQLKLLEWVMVGDPGGTMKVTVTQGTIVVDQRDASTIPPGFSKGYDAFEIQVA